MKHLILGYGYCGYYLARELLKQKQSVTAIARTRKEAFDWPGLALIEQDIHQSINLDLSDTVLYYLIPPQAEGQQDVLLRTFLSHLHSKPAKVIYFGSSAVYGDHQGRWVDEQSPCHIKFDRQRRRLDAEQQWQQYGQQQQIPLILLRIAGIYGPGRLPLKAIKEEKPVLNPKQAPLSNHIFVKDLAGIAAQLALSDQSSAIFNVSDGQPKPMGSIQLELCRCLNYPIPPLLDVEQMLEQASPMMREFLDSSKSLRIKALQTTLANTLKLTPMKEAIVESLKDEGAMP